MKSRKQKYMTRTVHVTLDIDDETLQRIKITRDVYAQVFNIHTQWSSDNHSTDVKQAHTQLYEGLRNEYPLLPSAMIQCARNNAFGSMKGHNSNHPDNKWKNDIVYSAASMKYDRRTVSLNSKGIFTFSLCGGKRGKASIAIPHYFLDRYGDWQFNSASIGIDRNGRPFANLSYRKRIPSKKQTNTHRTDIVGIDRGIYNIASTSDGVNFSSKKVRGRKRQLQYNKSRLQAKAAHGSRSAKRRLVAQRGKDARFSKNELDIITKKLATRSDVSVYVLEDLTDLYQQRKSKNFNRLKNTWAPAKFEFLLTYKCELAGIDVVKIDPRYTSQRCNACGKIEKKNRRGSRYNCRYCGYVCHADINAACNIRDKYISTLPVTNSVVQGVCQPPNDALTDLCDRASHGACPRGS